MFRSCAMRHPEACVTSQLLRHIAVSGSTPIGSVAIRRPRIRPRRKRCRFGLKENLFADGNPAPCCRRLPPPASRLPVRLCTTSTMAEGEGAAENPSPPPRNDEQQSRLPKVTLKTPPTREDIPRLDAVVKLMTHDFSSRQRQRLASNNAFKAITVRDLRREASPVV